MNKELKLGIFISLMITMFSVLLFLVGNFSLGKFYKFHVLFNNIDGISMKSPVKMSGVEIGTVVSMELKNSEVLLTLKIKDDIKISRKSKFRISSTGIVGTKFLEIYMTEKDYSDDYIKPNDILKGDEIVSMSDIMTKVSNIFDNLTGKDGFENSDISKILKNVQQITEKINKGLGSDEKDVREIVTNLRAFSESLGQISKQDIKNLSGILSSLNSASAKIDLFMQTLNSKNGTIGALVNDEELAKQVRETVDSLKNVSGDIKKLTGRAKNIEIYWNTDFTYNYSDNMGRTGAGIVIQTSPDKRYILKGRNFDFDTDLNYDEGDQRYNSITALIERDLTKNITIHAGIMNSSAGAGAKIKKGKVGLESDIYRMYRENSEGDTIPWMDMAASYQILKWAKVKIGVSDIFERKDLTTGVEISVKDEDIAYLFGLLGLAKL
jgi:phospholipid/cholesterol/gamma-HCH transport system substrate-binding protein